MIWVVTGATGLIGRALVPTLLERDCQVFALSRSAGNFYAGLDHPGLEARNFDLIGNSSINLGKRLGDVGLIMLATHITTSTDMRMLGEILSLDTFGHLRLVDALRPALRHMIYASSCTAYGRPSCFPVDEATQLAPENVYALSKVASERALSIISQNWNISLSILRISQIYGPGASQNDAMYTFLRNAYLGERPRITCSPDNFRDYFHVSDVVQAIETVALHQSTSVYNIGSGHKTTIKQLAMDCLKAADRDFEPIFDYQTPVANMWLDISRAQNELDYNPKIKLELGVQMEYQRLYAD
jgi:UDP-glucose 4-epimerase